MEDNAITWLDAPAGTAGERLAVRHVPGEAPGVLWCGGFMSDMTGTKASALAAWAAERGRAATLFDYSGHGASDGAFTDGTISRWLADARAVFDAFCRGPTVVVGSSMGAWIALLLVRGLRAEDPDAAAERVPGLVLVAPAPDFTERLMWPSIPEEGRRAIMERGVWHMPSNYGDPYPITRALIEDGRKHLVMDGEIETGCPVHVIQGTEDEEVPVAHARALVSRIAREDVVFSLVPGGDHRLSRPEDIALLLTAVEGVTEPAG
jgi:pimeloyl-ACP methyl ester carboxylesterase